MIAATIAAAGALVGVGTAGTPTPGWQDVPGGAIDHRAFALTAGRAWVVDGPPEGGPVIARSARVSGTGLSGWTATPLADAAGWGYLGLLGDSLIFLTRDQSSDGVGILLALKLQSSGRVGPSVDVTALPAATASDGAKFIRLRDRVLQFTDAKPTTDAIELGVCCDANGKVADYSSLARPSGRPLPYLGLDRHGRLWLAWTNIVGSQANTAWIVQLDSTTLQPIGVPKQAPLRFALITSVVCADVCRLVIGGASASRSVTARSFSWASGESSATPLYTPVKFGSIVAAHYDGGRLVVAYTAQTTQGLTVALARGDVRGNNLKPGVSLAVPETIGAFASGLHRTVGPLGVFGSGGFLAVTVYEKTTGAKHAVRVAVLPLRF